MEAFVIRADSSVAMGTGHVMRCLALAEGLERMGGRIMFLQAETTLAMKETVRQRGFATEIVVAQPGSREDASLTVSAARLKGARWVVADGYAFGADWQQQVKAAAMNLLVIDDYGHAGRYYADLVLNQNLSARAELYSNREVGTRLLLGTRFALLRREFLLWRGRELSRSNTTRRILVSLGGSDPDNTTEKVVQALMMMTEIDAIVVVGGSNPNRGRLEARLASRPDIRLLVNVVDMAGLMAWADVAVAAAGSTSWEMASLGLPSVVLIIAANQAEVAPALAREGISINLGEKEHVESNTIAEAVSSLLADLPRRQRMSERARALVDGRGTGRIVTRLQAATLSLKRAGPEDCQYLWEWVNDSAVRASAFNPTSISWETHKKWFADRLGNANSIIYIGSDSGGGPIGQVRFDWDERNLAEVDVSIAPKSRNAGWGSALIRRAVDEIFTRTPVQRVTAYIKSENRSSIAAFEKAGFFLNGATNKDGHRAVELTISACDE